MIKAHVHSVETMGALDGPGIRYVLFLQGCPFRCKFCHNPDTWRVDDKKLMSSEDIYQDVLKYADFFKFSGGGFTASGGEPLMQADFLLELFKKLKALGISTAIDTCGYADITETIDKLTDLTDLFMLDIKHLDVGPHKELTGRPNDKVIAFLKYLNSKNKRVWIRVVLLEGMTASEEYMRRLAEFLKGYKIDKVELLPFHKLGEHKWEQLGLKYELKNIMPPPADRVEKLAQILRDNNLTVSVQ